MNFTYKAYVGILDLLKDMKYKIVSYDNYYHFDRCAVVRHDVDYRLQNALEIAQIEREIGGVTSTYFLLVTSDFYNVFSASSMNTIEGILECGHEVGLHFDEMRYPDLSGNEAALKDKIIAEAEALSKAVGKKVTKVSMHRPSKYMLASNMEIPGMINTYSTVFFREFKYLSDSRRVWREPVEDIIRKCLYNKLQILVHPFWYYEEELDIQETVKYFINHANAERYRTMEDNISNLEEIMKLDSLHS